MFADTNSTYILILKSTFTKEVRAFDVQNTGESRLYLTFENFDWPDKFAGVEFDYYLVWCRLDHHVVVAPDPLDSVITVTTDEGTEESFRLRDLTFDTGVVKVERNPVGYYSLSLPRPYYSLSR